MARAVEPWAMVSGRVRSATKRLVAWLVGLLAAAACAAVLVGWRPPLPL